MSHIKIPISEGILEGDLDIPMKAKGLVIFAHGSGSSRLSPRNRQVVKTLQKSDIGTLLFDLLTPAEEKIDNLTTELRFNIDFLTTRLQAALNWYRKSKNPDHAIGLFGASRCRSHPASRQFGS